MLNVMDVEENKIPINLNSYSLVLMGVTGVGKTYTLNKILTSMGDGKKPLFIMLEDRYQHIPGIMAIRVRSIPELEGVKNQLKNPKVKDKYSCIVIDTADKLDVMIENYIASSKGVEITGDLKFGAGNKIIKNKLYFIDELRQNGWTVHFLMQSYENTNIITQETKYDIRVNKETWSKVSHDAFLIGMLDIEGKNDERILTFKRSEMYPHLKDSLGMPKKVKASEFKDVLTESIQNIPGAKFTSEDTISYVPEKTETFDEVKEKGMALGSLLFENGRMDEALNVLKTNIGVNEDGSIKTFDSLVDSQIDLARLVVIKLEELVMKFNL